MSEQTVAVATTPVPPEAQPPSAALISPPVSDAPSPAPEASREPKPQTVELVSAVVPSFEMLMRKPVRRRTVEFMLPQEEGDPVSAKVEMEAIDGPAYDTLQSKFPPTALQRARGQAFDPDKFGPALLERVVKQPSLTVEQWTQLWNNPRWSGGELTSLFWSANGLCLEGLDVPLPSSV